MAVRADTDTAMCLGLLSARLAPRCPLVGSSLHSRKGAGRAWSALLMGGLGLGLPWEGLGGGRWGMKSDISGHCSSAF